VQWKSKSNTGMFDLGVIFLCEQLQEVTWIFLKYLTVNKCGVLFIVF
jgi:hypothetical protein